jgi:hypothetical protein
MLEQGVVAQSDLEKYAKNGDQNDKGDKNRPEFAFIISSRLRRKF